VEHEGVVGAGDERENLWGNSKNTHEKLTNKHGGQRKKTNLRGEHGNVTLAETVETPDDAEERQEK